MQTLRHFCLVTLRCLLTRGLLTQLMALSGIKHPEKLRAKETGMR